MESSVDQAFCTTIVNIEEQLRGWLALIHRTRDVDKQIPVYERLAKLVAFFAKWEILPWDDRATAQWRLLSRARTRIGAQDLKIASIALAHDALLLSANLRDFRRVPRLRVESWVE
jgi:tRNA(fMet)-specific endonuclease VapC